MARDQIELLLQSWLNMELSIRGNRVLTEMSFNEMIVCNYVLRYRKHKEQLTAADLCDRMHMLKSQMNTMIADMERRGYVRRVRSISDRRKSYVELTEAGEDEYRKEHQLIIKISQAIIDEIGEDDIPGLIRMLDTATRIYQKNVPED